MTVRIRLVGVAMAGMLALPAAPATATPVVEPGRAPGQVSAPVPELRWQDCGDGLQCATARVPLDYDHPNGRTISLALLRAPATDPARRIGSLFINPGGPGGSAVDFVRNFGRLAWAPEVQARFDIVAMDPRGVGGSTPVRCFDTVAEQDRFFTPVRKAPSDRARYAAAVAAAREVARACRARHGDLLEHLSTANVARDLDLLRQAVGDAGLTYDGLSYGSYLAATYAALFPDRVRALVLDGNLDPPRYRTGERLSTTWVRSYGHVGAAETLGEFFRLCTGAGTRCAFAAGGDPRAKFDQLAARLRAQPVQLPDGLVIDYGTLLLLTFGGLYFAADWAAVAQGLQELYTGTGGAAASRLARGAAGAEPYLNVPDAQTANVCGETTNPRRPADYLRVAAAADRRAPHAGSWVTWVSFACTFWTARDADRYLGSFRVRTAPALLINNRYDPITPWRNAVTMARLLPGSRVLTVAGWGHTSMLNPSACSDRHRAAYLVDRTLPPPGATCAPDVVPFSTVAVSRAVRPAV